MAYASSTEGSSANVPFLISQSVGSTAGGGTAQWLYKSTHTSTEVTEAGFITDGQDLGMDLADVVGVLGSTTYTLTWHTVTAVSGTGVSLSTGSGEGSAAASINLSTAVPEVITTSTGGPGTSTDAARADHVHKYTPAAASTGLTATSTELGFNGALVFRSSNKTIGSGFSTAVDFDSDDAIRWRRYCSWSSQLGCYCQPRWSSPGAYLQELQRDIWRSPRELHPDVHEYDQ